MPSIKFLYICLIRLSLIITIFFAYSLSYAQKKSTLDFKISSYKEFDQLKNQDFIFLKKEDGRVEPRKISSTRVEQDLIHGILEIKTRDLSNKKIELLSFKSNSIVGIDKKGKNISAKMLSIGGTLSTKNEIGVTTRLEILSIRETKKSSYIKKYVVCTTELSESEEVSLASLMADSHQEGDFPPDISGITNLRNRLYAPNLGRFISPDPIHSLGFGVDEEGFLPELPIVNQKDPSQLHSFVYATNDPVNFIDPSGLSNISIGSVTSGLAGVSMMAATNSPAWSQVFQRGLTISQALQMNAQASYSMIAPRAVQLTQGVGQWVTVQFARGPGQIIFRNESASLRAQQYQEQISGTIFRFVYRLNGVHFDGFRDGRLLDAKGEGYARFIQPNGLIRPWWNGGAQQLVAEAQRQIAAANGTPIDWHVAELQALNGFRLLFQQHGITGINLIHTLPR